MIGWPPERRCGGERGHLLGEPLGRAEAARGHHQPLEPEPLVRERHPVALRADQVRGGDAHVLERDDRVVVADRVRVGRGPDHADARGRQVDQEHRVLAVVRPARQPGLEEGEVGGVVRGDVPLDPVEHVLVAVAVRGGLDRVDVRPRALLGDRVALLAVARDRRPDVALELVGRRDLRQPGRRGGRHPAERVGHPAHLLLDQHLLERGAAAAAQLDGHVGGGQAQLAGPLGVPGGHVGGQFTAGQLGLLLERDQLVGEAAGPGLNLAVCFGEAVHPVEPPGLRGALY